MGHHMVRNMLKVRAALDALTLEKDGVDGKSIYLYGEGWNFGEVANNARGVNATQLNLAGTGIGTFNDRSRDAVRGIGPFDGGQAARAPGLCQRQLLRPEAHRAWHAGREKLARLLLQSDQVRVGMAGNLANYHFHRPLWQPGDRRAGRLQRLARWLQPGPAGGHLLRRNA